MCQKFKEVSTCSLEWNSQQAWGVLGAGLGFPESSCITCMQQLSHRHIYRLQNSNLVSLLGQGVGVSGGVAFPEHALQQQPAARHLHSHLHQPSRQRPEARSGNAFKFKTDSFQVIFAAYLRHPAEWPLGHCIVFQLLVGYLFYQSL